jgi:hypothetical protein
MLRSCVPREGIVQGDLVFVHGVRNDVMIAPQCRRAAWGVVDPACMLP